MSLHLLVNRVVCMCIFYEIVNVFINHWVKHRRSIKVQSPIVSDFINLVCQPSGGLKDERSICLRRRSPFGNRVFSSESSAKLLPRMTAKSNSISRLGFMSSEKDLKTSLIYDTRLWWRVFCCCCCCNDRPGPRVTGRFHPYDLCGVFFRVCIQ